MGKPAAKIRKYGIVSLSFVAAAVIFILLYFFGREYIIDQVEKRVRDTMLEYRAFHQYVQHDMHPSYYELISEGILEEDFYAPEILSSSYIARNVSFHFNEERLKVGLPEVSYKIAAVDPRNPINKANEREAELIKLFNEDRTMTSYREIIEEDGEEYLLLAQPFLEVKPQCLKCHGEPSTAPAALQARYNWKGAWNLQVGEIIAAEIVRSPLKGEFDISGGLMAGLILLLSCGFILLVFNNKLQRQVEIRTQSLQKTEAQKNIILNRHSAVLSSISDAIISTNFNGIIRVFNPSAEKMFRISADEAIGSSIARFCPDELITEQTEILRKLKNDGTVDKYKTVRIRNDGTRFPVEITLSFNKEQESLNEGFIASLRDISEELRTEQLEEEYRQVKRVESIGRLAGGVAHDLNNMLTPVIGFSELLLVEESLNDSQKEWLKQIQQAGIRSRDLVSQLLAFGRKQTLSIKKIDLKEVFHNLKNLLKSTIRENIEIQFNEYKKTLPIMADYRQLEQVIMNLAINAADAMPQGGVLTFSMDLIDLNTESQLPDLAPGAYAELTVSDTGTGMDAEVRNKVFEPFYTTKGEKGTGLGLATVFGIIRQHNGNIFIESKVGRGTSFRIYLPIAENDNKTSDLNHSDEQEGSEHPCGHETILLVEDDKLVSQLTATILRKSGYNLLIAHSAEEALSLLKDNSRKMSLILTDVIMPGMNGKEMYQKIAEAQQNLKVIFMSGYPNDVIAEQGVLEEGLEFIQKPFTQTQLLGKIRKLLDKT